MSAVTVDAVVLCRILQGCADRHLEAHGAALGLAESDESLGQVGLGNADLAVGGIGAEGLAHLGAVKLDDGQGVVDRDVLVESHVEGARSELGGHARLVHGRCAEYGSGAVGRIEYGRLLA